jgi:hypothetical protein
MTFDEMKSVVMENLRGLRTFTLGAWTVDRLRDGIATDFDGSLDQTDADFTSVLFALVADGIIVPGQEVRPPFVSEAKRYFPYFSITSYGRKVLDPKENPVTPHDAAAYLAEAKRRMPGADDSITEYLVEATRAFEDRRYLSSTVMLGISGEAVMEWLYEQYMAHLPPDRLIVFKKSFENTRLRTERRFNDFRNALNFHKAEFPLDLWYRVETYLDSLNAIVKVNRDDIAHRRARRVDEQLALGNLTIFPTLLTVVNDLATALRDAKCSAWETGTATT